MTKLTMGEFLAALRKSNGFTQQDVAEKLNVSDRTLSSWETGRTAPDLLLLPALADLYGVTVDEILRGERSQTAQPMPENIADGEQSAARENAIETFLDKRNICTACGVISALVFLIGCVTLLYSKAPLWLNALIIICGAGANIASVILLFRFERQTRKAIDCEADNALKLTLIHSSSIAFIFNSLPYICGAIVLEVCYFATGIDEFAFNSSNVIALLDAYTSYGIAHSLCVFLCAGFGMALFIWGVLRIDISAHYIGNARQKAAVDNNVKLFKKLCLFGLIPVALSFILVIIFSFVKFKKVDETYFTANGIEEVVKTFQTISFDDDTKIVEHNGTATIPKGEYYLHSENGNYVCCTVDLGVQSEVERFYDLGNKFYCWNERIYYLKDGVSAEDIQPANNYQDYFIYYKSCGTIDFESPDGEQMTAYTVSHSYYDSDNWYYGIFYGENYNSTYDIVLTRSGSVYTYQKIDCYVYFPLFWYIFLGVTSATVLVCTAVQLVKRKKLR